MFSTIVDFLTDISLDEWLSIGKAVIGFVTIVAPLFL